MGKIAPKSRMVQELAVAYKVFTGGTMDGKDNQNHVDIAVLKTDLAYIKQAMVEIKEGVGEIKAGCKEERQCVNDLNARITTIETQAIASLATRISAMETEGKIYSKWTMYLAGIAGGVIGSVLTAIIVTFV